MDSRGAGQATPAAKLLMKQLKEIQATKDLPGVSCGLVDESNIFEWEVMLMIGDDCKYYGGATPTPLPSSTPPSRPRTVR